MKIVAFLIVFSIYCVGCRRNETYNDNPEVIDIGVSEEFQPLIADSLFSDVKYIPLETQKNSLLVDIDKYVETDSFIYILDKKQESLLVFDQEGKYLKKLDKKGRGRGEYVSLDDFFVQDSLIYVLSSAIQKILLYDADFNFVSDFKTKTYGTNICILEDTLFLFGNFASSDLENFFAYDPRTGKLLGKHGSFPKKQLGVRYRQSTFSIFEDEVFCFLPFDYSIYKLSVGGTQKTHRLNFGKENRCPPAFKDYSEGERTDYLKSYSDLTELPVQRIDNLYLDDHFLFFSFVKGIFPYCYIQRDHVALVGGISNTGRFPVINSKVLYVNREKYVVFERAENFFVHREKKYRFPSILDDLKVDDNPVLCVYTFKNN